MKATSYLRLKHSRKIKNKKEKIALLRNIVLSPQMKDKSLKVGINGRIFVIPSEVINPNSWADTKYLNLKWSLAVCISLWSVICDPMTINIYTLIHIVLKLRKNDLRFTDFHFGLSIAILPHLSTQDVKIKSKYITYTWLSGESIYCISPIWIHIGYTLQG